MEPDNGQQDKRNQENTANIIPTLYKLNKELLQLHHLFSNYKTLIDVLLTSVGHGNSRMLADMDGDGDASGDKNRNRNSHVPRARLLSVKAAHRFRRLQLQLQSLMLNAIQDCLDEKTSLQDTYFKLITQKDSQSTERLTSTATLLARLSVFFLPISFMTSYFSVQIPDLVSGFTAWTYWGTFAVIASISFISLFFFSNMLVSLSQRLDRWADQATRWTKSKAGIRQQETPGVLENEDEL